MASEVSIVNLRKRRGTIRGSVTRLGNSLRELEGKADQPDTADHATVLVATLDRLDTELKALHFQVIDLVSAEDERTLEKEQDYLDKHDNNVTAFKIRFQRLAAAASKTEAPTSSTRKMLSRKLSRLDRNLCFIEEVLDSMRERPDVSHVECIANN